MAETSADAPKDKLGRHVFLPSMRFLFDCLLIVNSFFFALLAVKAFPSEILLALTVGTNVFFILTWLFVVRPLLGVVIEDGLISGPSDVFARKTLLLRKVDVRRSLEFNQHAEWMGYRDLWSVDGEHIRLYRRFLGKPKHYQIVKLIKEHPFRESAPPAA